jgi:biopolymer transport protein ExbD
MRFVPSLVIVIGVSVVGCTSTHKEVPLCEMPITPTEPAIQLSADPGATQQEVQSAQTFTVAIAKDQSVSVDGKTVPVEDLTTRLSELGSNGSQPVTIKVHSGAPHGGLVAVLDALAKAGYANVSVMSD